MEDGGSHLALIMVLSCILVIYIHMDSLDAKQTLMIMWLKIKNGIILSLES